MKVTTFRIAFVGLLLGGLVWDFSSRIYVPREVERRQFVPPKIEPVTPLRSPAAIRLDLERWLPGVHGTAGLVSDEISALSDLRLVGTFVDPIHAFAVLGVGQSGAGDIRMEKVNIGEEISGFRLADVDDHVVVLQRGEESFRLKILDVDLAEFSVRGSPSGQDAESRKGAATSNSDKQKSLPDSPLHGAQTQKAGVSALSSSRDESRQPKALAPGEEAILPWDLPVVDELGKPIADKHRQ